KALLGGPLPQLIHNQRGCSNACTTKTCTQELSAHPRGVRDRSARRRCARSSQCNSSEPTASADAHADGGAQRPCKGSVRSVARPEGAQRLPALLCVSTFFLAADARSRAFLALRSATVNVARKRFRSASAR